jgi:fructose-1,6-bisphosphatase/sedoheptulose 1,7-bisphosphatase-like protein
MAAVIARVSRGVAWFKWYLDSAPEERDDIIAAGFDPDKIYTMDDLASGHVFISISSITGTDMLPPVEYRGGGVLRVATYFGRSRTGTWGVEFTNHTDGDLEDTLEDIPEGD